MNGWNRTPGDGAADIARERSTRDATPAGMPCLHQFASGRRCAKAFDHDRMSDPQHVAISSETGEWLVTEVHREPRGLRCDILKLADGSDFSNGGISSVRTQVTLVGDLVDEVGGRVSPPSVDAPAVEIGYAGNRAHLRPVVRPTEYVGPMASGAYVASTDSRFRELSQRVGMGGSAIPLHDRFETAAQYARLSSD